MRLEVPEVETLAAGGAPQGDYVPVKQPGIALQVDAGGEFGLGGAEHDGLLRQPFQRRTRLNRQLQFLIGRPAGAVPLGRAGAGQLRPGAFGDMGRDVEAITAGNPARRVHDDVLAHLGAFGVQVLLHPQRAEVTAHHRARGVAEARVAEFQLGVPAGGEQRGGGR